MEIVIGLILFGTFFVGLAVIAGIIWYVATGYKRPDAKQQQLEQLLEQQLDDSSGGVLIELPYSSALSPRNVVAGASERGYVLVQVATSRSGYVLRFYKTQLKQ